MAIPEGQLETWSHQGSIHQSKSTYAIVRNALESQEAQYPRNQCEIFLQGSYGNNTNIYADSDVDVIILLDSIYYYDLSALSEEDQKSYHQAYGRGNYSYNEFKKDVISQLVIHFGGSVVPGKKAIKIHKNGSRRDCDVLPAVQHRKYERFKSVSDNKFVEGICFWASDGIKIVNYPRQHSVNCTIQHKNTKKWFKPTVRTFKNMRNRMISDRMIRNDLAPSYFIEGMLYNVTSNQFGSTFQSTVANCINWLEDADSTKLVCANEQYFLLFDSSPVCWNQSDFNHFISKTIEFWNAW